MWSTSYGNELKARCSRDTNHVGPAEETKTNPGPFPHHFTTKGLENHHVCFTYLSTSYIIPKIFLQNLSEFCFLSLVFWAPTKPVKVGRIEIFSQNQNQRKATGFIKGILDIYNLHMHAIPPN